jgi:hypothetical protein
MAAFYQFGLPMEDYSGEEEKREKEIETDTFGGGRRCNGM